MTARFWLQPADESCLSIVAGYGSGLGAGFNVKLHVIT